MNEKSSKRPGTMSDDQRATIGKHHRNTPAGGVVAVMVDRGMVMIDEEVTPPPREPPTPDELGGMPTEDQISALRDVVEDQARGLERIWEARHMKQRVDHIFGMTNAVGQDVAKLVQLMNEFVMPAVKTMMGRLEIVERSLIKLEARVSVFMDKELPDMVRTIDSLDTQMRRVEKDVDRLERDVNAFMKRAEEATAGIRTDINTIKNDQLTHSVRLRNLEDWKLRVSTQVALIATAVGTAVAGIAWLINKFA